MGLIEDVGRGPVGVDTALFIYFIEEEPRYLPVIEPLFKAADEGSRELVTSALTLLEVLVVPYRAGDLALAERYEALLTRSRGIRIIGLSMEQLRAAAQLRAVTGAKTPDALQLVAALLAGCATFLTNDRRIPSIPGTRILQLSDYVS
ncbi:MAG TPA: PIN domain-containing protein [Gammaproteobacteria bacterium]|nr:PIN domain-containing protein [Gammaproteobacteria bacterium]